MKKFIIVILIAMLLFDTFLNRREIDQIAIATCIGIDITEDGKYDVCVNVLNTKKDSSTSSETTSEKELSKIQIYEIEADSIQYALRNIVTVSHKKLYLGHVKLVILSEQIAKENIMDTLDYFIRDYEGGNTFLLAISKDVSPKKLMRELSKNSDDFTQDIVDSINSSHRYKGNTVDDILNDNLRTLLEEGNELVLNTISIEEVKTEEENDNKSNKENSKDETLYNLKICDLAYFKGNKLAGYLESEIDDICYNFIKNDINTGLFSFGEDKNRVIFEVIGYDIDMVPEIKEEYIVNIKVKLKCNITEIGEDIFINTDEDLKNIITKAENEAKKCIYTYIDNCKNKYQADIMGLGKLFFRYKFKDYEHNRFYNEIFSNIKVNLDLKVEIPNAGGVKKIGEFK